MASNITTDNPMMGNRTNRKLLRTVGGVSIVRKHAQAVGDRYSAVSCVLTSVSVTLNDETFAHVLQEHVQISVTSSSPQYGIDAAMLARNWGIGIEAANQTIKVTTQRGVRTVTDPALSRRFRTNDRQL
jgi:hypothetical protein